MFLMQHMYMHIKLYYLWQFYSVVNNAQYVNNVIALVTICRSSSYINNT